MKFIKGGIVTRIDFNYKDISVIEKYFNRDLFYIYENKWLLKEDVLNDNIIAFRDELLKLTENKGDCIDNSDAYILNCSCADLLYDKIILCNDNKKYFYSKFSSNKFDTLFLYEYIYSKRFKIYFIPIIWDISDIYVDDKDFFIIFINNLIRNSLNNCLKYSSWFTITK